MISIATLITCHNRKDKTLRCLNALFSQSGLNKNFELKVFLVDDRCTDGTSQSVAELFPDVNIIEGNGNLYWNRGMHLAWETAANSYDFDYYLWLNDDTTLYENVFIDLQKLLDPNRVIGGATYCIIMNQVSYGGYIKKRLITPSDKLADVDYLNGNFVIVPKLVMNTIGILDSYFHHALGDFDYSLRAKKNGFELKLLPFYVGVCESNSNKQFWSDSSNNIFERIRYLYSPMSGCKFPEFFVFDLRHNGILLSIFHFFTIHSRVIFPRLVSLTSNGGNKK